MRSEHTVVQPVSFGDCDPAGIVFYPNVFRWMDMAFHDYLRRFGGHADICRKTGSIGIGLMSATAEFRSPMRDGDRLEISLSVTRWGDRTLSLFYEGRVGDRIAFEGKETRGLFKEAERGVRAGDMSALRKILEE